MQVVSVVVTGQIFRRVDLRCTKAKHDSDTIVKFMRGEIRGWQDCIKDPEYGAHLTVSKYAKGAGLSLKATVLEIETDNRAHDLRLRIP